MHEMSEPAFTPPLLNLLNNLERAPQLSVTPQHHWGWLQHFLWVAQDLALIRRLMWLNRSGERAAVNSHPEREGEKR